MILRSATRWSNRCSCLHLCSPCYRALSQSHIPCAGHNKWSKIKQKKAIEDGHKGALYTKAARDITVAIRTGGSGDPAINTTLAITMKKYKTMGVPKENIESAVAKATGAKAAGSQSTTYEAMAGKSVGLMIECLTSNPNRTVSALRDILTKYGARTAPVGFLFNRAGLMQITVPPSGAARDHVSEIMMAAVDAGAEQFDEWECTDTTDNPKGFTVEIRCPPEKLHAVTQNITTLSLPIDIQTCELVYEPSEQAEANVDEVMQEKVAALVDALDGNEDTLRVWTTLR